ncbi:MAG: hypothetical protein ACR2NP_21250 [Pirellulaceae bacterium]
MKRLTALFALSAATLFSSLLATDSAEAQYPVYQRPVYPVHVTPNQLIGFNPQTGPITFNQQIDNTAFDFGRNQSRNNQRRWVNRPVYNTMGQITGYEQGWEWTNMYTGQSHGDTQVITHRPGGGMNIMGHTHMQSHHYGSPGMHIQNHVRGGGGMHVQGRTRGGTHVQRRSYGGG